MKFNIQSKLFFTHLQAVSKVVNSKNTISILNNFLFNLSGNTLVITASDQETTLTTHVEVTNAEGSGKFAAGVKELLDMLKELPDQGLTVDINDQNLAINITYMNGEFNFIGMNGNEFPVKTPSEDSAKVLTLPVEKVTRGIQQTVFAVGTESLRPMMMGIFWDIKPDEIAFVSTDTHKLVRFRELGLETGMEQSFILPTKPATILASILDKQEGDVKITIDSKSATFESADYTLSCRFVNGRYPNYNSVIPQDNQFTLTIDRMTMLAAIKRVSVTASPGGLVKFDLKENQIHLSTQDIDFSKSSEEVVACDYTGAEMLIGFNDENIIDVLNNIDNDMITVELMDPSRAGIFKPAEQRENEDLLVLLMPMMVIG